MYISSRTSLENTPLMVPVTAPEIIATAPFRAQWVVEYCRVALKWLWTWFMQLMGDIRTFIVNTLSAIQSSFTSLKPSINSLVNKILSFSLDWPDQAVRLVGYIILTYPHAVHTTAWLVFFGPLAILCPLLLIYEASIAIAFNVIFIFHGLIPGTPEKNYLELRESTDDVKQWMFVYIDQATNTYNKWTMESNPLLIFRLLAGATGIYVLCNIWST